MAVIGTQLGFLWGFIWAEKRFLDCNIDKNDYLYNSLTYDIFRNKYIRILAAEM